MLKTYIEETLEACLGEDETIALADGFEKAFVGVARQFNRPFAVYDTTKCLALLMEQGMDLESAHEYMSFNVEGAWVGDNTPAFMHMAQEDWEKERCKLITALVGNLAACRTILRGITQFVSPEAFQGYDREMCDELLRTAQLLTSNEEGGFEL